MSERIIREGGGVILREDGYYLANQAFSEVFPKLTVYNSFFDSLLRGQIDVVNVTFKVMLTTSDYFEDKDTHIFRSHVTNEIAAISGYVSGGEILDVVVNKDNINDRVDIILKSADWVSFVEESLTAQKAVYYASNGTPETDRLVAALDFGSNQTVSDGGILSLSDNIIRINN